VKNEDRLALLLRRLPSGSKVEAGAGPGLQPAAGHLITAVRLAPRQQLSRRRWRMVVDMYLDAQALDRIIQAVGKRYSPTKLDRFALRRELDKSEKSAELISVNRHGARSRARLKRLKQIRESAERLSSLLQFNDDATAVILHLQQDLSETTLTTITRLIISIDSLEHMLSEGAGSPYGNPTPVEWLAGVELPCIFEEHFHRNPGGSRTAAGRPDGPCVRFVVSTLRELGFQYSAESILRAMTRLRTLRRHRRQVRGC